MEKHDWFLHGKDWDEGDGRFGTSLFVVCPSLRISIKLEKGVGYLTGYNTIESARDPAFEEGLKLVAMYNSNKLPLTRVTKGIKGKRMFPNPVVTV